MDKELVDEMGEIRKKCASFIRDTSTPIKKQHMDDIKKYLERFIAFPGGLSVVSIIFTSSSLVKNQWLAILGFVIIISSLLIALNIFRQQINIDKNFYAKIVGIEAPMVTFSRSFTLFSREQTKQRADTLEVDYNALLASYEEDTLAKEDNEKNIRKFNSIYSFINLSFWLLVIGVVISFFSVFGC